MCGFNRNENYPDFIGDSINVFGIYRYGLILTLESDRHININGLFEIIDPSGKVIMKVNSENN